MSTHNRPHETLRVAYVIANEDLTSPLLTRQVVELLSAEVAQAGEPLDINLLLFQTVPSLIKRRKRLRDLKRKMKRDGVKLSIIPNLTPWPFPNLTLRKTPSGWRPNDIWNRFAARAFGIYAFPFLLYHYLFRRRRIFHSRSYPPAIAISALKKILPSLKHIFDPRSDFPEENVVAGRWETDSPDFQYWKRSEASLLVTADATVCISEVYVDHFKKSASIFPHFIAPNNVDTDFFVPSLSARARLRHEMGWDEDDLVFVYLGGMSRDGWHRPESYREFLSYVRIWMPSAKLLFLIPGHANAVASECFSGVSGVEIRNPPYDEVPEYLSAADVGLMYMHRRRLAVGTKLGEYLAIGLPVLCNANCLGTCGFLNDHRESGRVLNIGLGDLDSHKSDLDADELWGLARGEGTLRSLAVNHFSNRHIARRYVKWYESLGK